MTRMVVVSYRNIITNAFDNQDFFINYSQQLAICYGTYKHTFQEYFSLIFESTKIAVNSQPVAPIAYRATTNGATTFCFVVWVFKKKEIATRSVNKFVL